MERTHMRECQAYHDQKQILFIMETPPEFDYERICPLCRHAAQHGLLCERVLKFLMGEHMSLGNCLEGIQIRAAFMAYKEHLSCTSFAEYTHHLKVGHLDFAREALLGAWRRLGTFLSTFARGIDGGIIFGCGG
jgi:hypothetical protein